MEHARTPKCLLYLKKLNNPEEVLVLRQELCALRFTILLCAWTLQLGRMWRCASCGGVGRNFILSPDFDPVREGG